MNIRTISFPLENHHAKKVTQETLGKEKSYVEKLT